MKIFAYALAAAIIGFSAVSVSAHEYKLGALEIVHPHARATAPNAPVSGGYMTIHNTGKDADRLVSGKADFADRFEIHEMTMQGDVMKMRQLAGGLEIPAGGEVELKPGGYHIMFIGLKEPLKAGEHRSVTLTFEKAGSIDVDFSVETIQQMQGKMKHGDMKMDDMKQGKMKQGDMK